MLNAQPTSNHKGSNDAMAAEGQARIGRLPYGMDGWQHHRPVVLYCPECQVVCPARHVPSKLYALEYKGQCDSEIRRETNHDPPQPGEWELDTKLIELLELGMNHKNMPFEAYTHLNLVHQMLRFLHIGEHTIRDMFERRRKDGLPTCHDTYCKYVDHDEPYAEEAPQQEVVPQEEALQQGEAPRDEESPEGGRPPKRARTGEAAGAAEATTAGSGK